MKDSQLLIESITLLNSTLERLISKIESLSGDAPSAVEGVYHEADALRKANLQSTEKLRNRVRNKSEIEIQGAVPFVVKCLMQNMTYVKTAEYARQAGYKFSNQSVARFYQNIAVSKVEGNRIYVVLKCGDTYEIDANTYEIVSMTGKI